MTVEKIIALAIEEPDARKALHDSHRIYALRRAESSGMASKVRIWVSRALYAIDDSHGVHDIWSKTMQEPITDHEMQHLMERSVCSESDRLSRLITTLKYVSFYEEESSSSI